MAQNEQHTNVAFETVGRQTDTIDVKISHRIIQLFSEGLYSSSNKAVEELVSNSFDAGAQNVHVILSPDLRDADATIVVLDDGEGMDVAGTETTLDYRAMHETSRRAFARKEADR